MWMELAVIFGIYSVGSILFGQFETQTPRWKKLVKLVMFGGITVLIYATVGRPWSLLWLVLPMLAVAYIHAVWLPKHGINGWTAEPRDKYFALRGWKTS
ncbi:MAG: hypothetical protein HC853_18975 [Anaerolineae bacterium]|nr:hypothetical protein [Anaerolineae bacterium]